MKWKTNNKQKGFQLFSKVFWLFFKISTQILKQPSMSIEKPAAFFSALITGFLRYNSFTIHPFNGELQPIQWWTHTVNSLKMCTCTVFCSHRVVHSTPQSILEQPPSTLRALFTSPPKPHSQ